MSRILLCCLRDWRHPFAGPVESYVYNVFSRIAAQGSHVTWACGSGLLARLGRERPLQMETVDGIQVAPLAPRLLYRRAAAMLSSRLAAKIPEAVQLDALVDCICGTPLPLEPSSHFPIIPIVFDLDKKQRAHDTPPGPIIAPSARMRRRLIDAGVRSKFIVSAFTGCDTDFFVPGAARAFGPTVVAVGRGARSLQTLLRRNQPGLAVDRLPANATPEDRRAAYQTAWLGYCGPGSELEALTMAACGLPVICWQSDSALECVEDGRTGFLLDRRDRQGLLMRIQQLMTDEPLRQELSGQAREYAEGRSWQRTASLVLATIENLKPLREAVGTVR